MTATDATDAPGAGRLGRGLTLFLAAATGLAVANIYYNQPMLALIARDLQAGAHVSLVATATQVGYALGLVLLVPLGDTLDRRPLILAQGVGLMAATAGAALAPSLTLLVVASAAVGVFATIAQQLIPLAAELAAPQTRGRAVGTLMAGLLVGILLARTLSGVVGEYFGWRAMFGLGTVIAAVMTIGLALRLPNTRPETRHPYGRLLLSLLHLVRDEPELRRAAATQGLIFAGFTAFWTILSLLLQSRFGLGSDVAGLFGILALGGVFLAPIAGGLADRRGPEGVVTVGAALVLASFVLMALWLDLRALAVGVVIMDAGMQLAMVSNQSIIFALAGSARGRFNTVFVTTLFACGAIGSAAASAAWSAGGWPAVMAMSACGAAGALALQLMRYRRRPESRRV